jgi:hypothetical protein
MLDDGSSSRNMEQRLTNIKEVVVSDCKNVIFKKILLDKTDHTEKQWQLILWGAYSSHMTKSLVPTQGIYVHTAIQQRISLLRVVVTWAEMKQAVNT